MSDNVVTISDDFGSGVLIDVECHLSNSLPNIVIVGIANKAVDEAKERIRSAFASSKIKLPKKRIVLNLSPADIPKEGSSFDLPMAVAILKTGQLIKNQSSTTKSIVLGEVGLDGSIKPIRGIVGKLLSAKKLGYSQFWIPSANLNQAKLIQGIEVWPVKTLKDIYTQLNTDGVIPFQQIANTPAVNARQLDQSKDSFDEIVGQEQAKRAMVISAAGGHNILLEGPPGTGKSMLAKALPDILPAMSHLEMLEATHIHSLTSKNYDSIVNKRPIRAPHHSASHIAIVGGGQRPSPGEISLSHTGVLFLDEFPEFGRPVIESLRQPLEDRRISVSRAKASVEFPANFILVATANPCPCGYYGSKKECSCLASQILKYQKKISGPVVDRIDLYTTVGEINHSQILSKTSSLRGQTKNMANAVTKARAIQLDRASKLNSQLNNKELKKYAELEDQALQVFNRASETLNLSGRGYIRTLKVARTIADLDGSKSISVQHITEALQYRRKEQAL